MEIISNIYFLVLNALILTIIVAANIIVVKRIIKNNKHLSLFNASFLWFLLLEHLLLGILFYIISLNSQVDSIGYFNTTKNSQSLFELFSVGTGFIRFIIYPFIKLGVSYFNLFFIFSTIGLIGIYKLYILLISEFKYETKKMFWVYFLFSLPTLHFFTNGIGKDNLIIFLLVLMFNALKSNKSITVNLIIFSVFLFLIRPHIFILFILSYVLVIFFSNRVKLLYKIALPLLALLVIIILSPIINEKFKMDIYSIDSINNALSRFSSRGARSNMPGSTVNFAKSHFLIKMFAFSYLPLFKYADNIFKYIVSLENLSLIVLFLGYFIKGGKYKFFKKGELYLKIMLVYSILTCFVLSLTIYNLGLSTRQKYMYIPYFYFTILLFFNNKKTVVIDKTIKS
ncbi:hypothetical protein [Pontimicrobium sp. MEBiC06410]